jgi:hypothetical protein
MGLERIGKIEENQIKKITELQEVENLRRHGRLLFREVFQPSDVELLSWEG